MKFSQARLKGIVRAFRGQKILALGDLMLDKYIWGDVSRISPEAPVPVVEVRSDSSCLGGAGNVYRNLKSLGAEPLLVGVVGNDAAGRWVRRNVPAGNGILVDEGRPTTVKTRIIAHHQQVVRIDLEKRRPISPAAEKTILRFIERKKPGGIILSDYGKGVLTESLLSKLLSRAREEGIMVGVDPKLANFSLFSPVTLLTPNHFEAEKIVRHECRTRLQVEKAGREIFSSVQAPYLIIKRGEQGMTAFERGKKPLHIPARAKEVFDVTGAGDTVIAIATLALLAGATIFEAACLANAAAGIVVGKIGTAVVEPGELLEAFLEPRTAS